MAIASTFFSLFNGPVTSTVPVRDVLLPDVYQTITSGDLQEVTDQVRANVLVKTEVLPFVTFSGKFEKRRISDLIAYTGFLCLDLDDCDLSLKSKVAEDKFLNPVLVFTSPRGRGLKVVVKVENAALTSHFDHFNALSFYLLETYNLAVDKSGSDVSRCCFLCQDNKAIYNPNGFVTSDKLLSYYPPDRTMPANVSHTGVPVFGPSSTTSGERPSDLLHRIPAVHEKAVSALRSAGWHMHPDGIHFTRPGKNPREGFSAVFNLHPTENVWIFTNFSSNAAPFFRKGYTDCSILALLEYGNDFTRCIKELSQQYLSPMV